MANLIGDTFTLNHDTSENWGTPTYVAQTNVNDLALDRGITGVQIDDRSGFTKYKSGRQDHRLTFTMNYDEANVFLVAIEGAVAAGTTLHIAIADGTLGTAGTVASGGTAGVNYWHAEYVVIGDPLSANLDEGATFEVELAPAIASSNTPVKVLNIS